MTSNHDLCSAAKYGRPRLRYIALNCGDGGIGLVPVLAWCKAAADWTHKCHWVPKPRTKFVLHTCMCKLQVNRLPGVSRFPCLQDHQQAQVSTPNHRCC
jgi:hypothetical protein